MCWYSTVGYRVPVMCLCVTVMYCYSTVGYRVTVMCVTVMCCYSQSGYRFTVMCVCYCNVLLQYSLGTGLLLCYVC